MEIICDPTQKILAQSARTREYADWISVERQDPHLTSALDMTIKSDGEVQVIMELWGMQSKPSLSLLSDPLSLEMVEPQMVLSMSKIEVNSVLELN